MKLISSEYVAVVQVIHFTVRQTFLSSFFFLITAQALKFSEHTYYMYMCLEKVRCILAKVRAFFFILFEYIYTGKVVQSKAVLP